MSLSNQFKNKFCRPDLVPELWDSYKKGFSLNLLRTEFIAALTIAIVAFPISMAIAIASNASPFNGLITAVIGGFIVSLFSGSRFQIGGPTAAFAIVVATIIAKYTYEGLLLASIMAGIILFFAAIFNFGRIMKYVPETIVKGFTSGIAITILLTQIGAFFGISLETNPISVFDKLIAYGQNINSLNPNTLALSLGCIVLIMIVKKLKPNWPNFLIAIILITIIAVVFKINTISIEDKYGKMSITDLKPYIFDLSIPNLIHLIIPAVTIAFLAGVESLLSASAAGAMTKSDFKPNAELLAQGFGNIATGFFGGLPVAGAISRTATNINAGGTSPLSGMLHAIILLFIIIVAGTYTGHIPLCALAALLIFIMWKMADLKSLFAFLKTIDIKERIVLLSVFFLTIFTDITIAVIVGMLLNYIVLLSLRTKNM